MRKPVVGFLVGASLLAVGAAGSLSSTQAAAGTVTFSEHIAPIVYKNCTTCHHTGEAVPFTLMNYDEVKRHGKTIAAVTERRYMPPWHGASEMGHFRDERGLNDNEIRLIRAWVDDGMPSGDLAKAPAAPQYTDGWRLGTPDLVVRMERPFEVPASGPDVFRNFAIKLNLKETKWVRAIDFRPSARVSHHALFFLDQTGEAIRLQSQEKESGFSGMSFLGGRGLEALLTRANASPNEDTSSQNLWGGLGGWAVGAIAHPLPDGLARPLAAGTDLVLQMHFHPTGKVEREQATVAFYFADKPPVKTLSAVQMPPLFGALAGINLAPGVKDFAIRDTFTVPVDVDVISMGAHAHYLATHMTLRATLPGRATRVLASVPKWDFNWQERYTYTEPIRLPKGTRLEVEIEYDNSVDNPNNPRNPPQQVWWGQQSFDEMGAMTLELVAANEEDLPEFRTAVLQHTVQAVLVGALSGANAGRGGLRGARGNRGR
ncbi:MAG TPA: hypothetical protein VFY29_05925 [Terriglobia bacterium]|nr:hypothetical protein [Terriglobia bacterium]